MEVVTINWLAVVLATIAAMAVGMAWYAKGVFGNAWIKLAKIDEKKMTQGSTTVILKALVMAFLTAFVLAHMVALAYNFYNVGALEAGLTTAFWLWLGVSATTVITHDSFEHRPTKLTFITIGYQFVSIMGMGAIIGFLGGF